LVPLIPAITNNTFLTGHTDDDAINGNNGIRRKGDITAIKKMLPPATCTDIARIPSITSTVSIILLIFAF
jgi:hypothetical protein